jgi:hypothetical protein
VTPLSERRRTNLSVGILTDPRTVRDSYPVSWKRANHNCGFWARR